MKQNTMLLPPEGEEPARVVWISKVNTGLGYALTDHNGELDEKVRTCVGCQHFGVHDFHYYYCSALYAQNQDPEYNAPYPWRGAGKQMNRTNAVDCPIGERNAD